MTSVFGPLYASTYDDFAAAKDYVAEVAELKQVFERYGTSPVAQVLDLGCGTGGHAVPLAGSGFSVTGVDRSADMLAIAADKAARAGTTVTFVRSDLLDVDCGTARFDAVLMMYAVLGYFTEDSDIISALRAARRLSEPGGLLIFDVWFGPAVLRQRPEQRVRRTGTGDSLFERRAVPELDIMRQVCTVSYDLRRGTAGATDVAREEHCVRYFFPAELRLLTRAANYEILRIGQWPGLEKDPNEESWNVAVVARAV